MGAEVVLATLPRTLQGQGPTGLRGGPWVGSRDEVEGSRHMGDNPSLGKI